MVKFENTMGGLIGIKLLLREKGNAMVMVIITVVALIGVTGLVIDYSHGVWKQTQMQKAADAAALAGASNLQDFNISLQVAANILDSNYGDYDDASFTPATSSFKVDVEDTVPTYFMKLFGHDTMDIGVTATAISEVLAGGLRGGAFPFALINPNLNDDPSDDLVPSNYGKPYILGYGEDNVNVGDWANGSDHWGSVSAVGPARGWRSALGLMQDGTMSNDAGADDVRAAMVDGWSGDLIAGDDAKTKTGNMTSVYAGREARLGDNPLPYSEFDPRIHSNNPRVIMVPIISLIHETRRDTYTVLDYENGAAWDHGEVYVDGFAPFFLISEEEQGDVDGDGKIKDADWITGYFLPPIHINNYLPPNGNAANFGIYSTARLID